MTKYFVDESGKFLGGFSGYCPKENITQKRTIVSESPIMEHVTDADGRKLFVNGVPLERQKFENGAPLTRKEVRHIEEIVGTRELPMVYPNIPEGAIEIKKPPRHGWDAYDLDKKEWISHDTGERYS